ncbi:MAG: 2Fe-2S iron-sulfur cluster-binding protein [Bdellovibrionota bacterium]
MGGKNPYIEPAKTEGPRKKYRITFLPENRTIEVDPAQVPYGRDGEPGSILDIALSHGVEIDHACGGVCACSTCHVLVKKGLSSIPEPSDAELDQLDNAPGNTVESRLACQAVPSGEEDITVEIPEWNRNLVREGHH